MPIQVPEIGEIPGKVAALVSTPSWGLLEEKFKAAEFVLFIGNGGNLAVAQHAASDVNRLTEKFALSPTNLSHFTAVACEEGVESWPMSWVQKTLASESRRHSAVLIGFSCSSDGASARSIVSASAEAASLGVPSFLLTAQPKSVEQPVHVICVDAMHYHTAELIYMASFYQLIASSGCQLPAIT